MSLAETLRTIGTVVHLDGDRCELVFITDGPWESYLDETERALETVREISTLINEHKDDESMDPPVRLWYRLEADEEVVLTLYTRDLLEALDTEAKTQL